jgi:dTDP-4-amino-4,6-dideoxygalactose transaminase
LYLEKLQSIPVAVPFKQWDIINEQGVSIGYHIMPILLLPTTDRLYIMNFLKSHGIQTSIHFPPAHRFSGAQLENHAKLPITEDVGARELTLPFYPTMTTQAVVKVCECLAEGISEAESARR